MANDIQLTDELERFTRLCVDSGRYDSVSEVVRAALRLLQDAEERRLAFDAMLDDVQADAAREGSYDIESVGREMEDIVRHAEK